MMGRAIAPLLLVLACGGSSTEDAAEGDTGRAGEGGAETTAGLGSTGVST